MVRIFDEAEQGAKMVFLVALVLVVVVVAYVSYPLAINDPFLEQAYAQTELERLGEIIEEELVVLRHEQQSHIEENSSE
jgi:hypothetical protein